MATNAQAGAYILVQYCTLPCRHLPSRLVKLLSCASETSGVRRVLVGVVQYTVLVGLAGVEVHICTCIHLLLYISCTVKHQQTPQIQVFVQISHQIWTLLLSRHINVSCAPPVMYSTYLYIATPTLSTNVQWSAGVPHNNTSTVVTEAHICTYLYIMQRVDRGISIGRCFARMAMFFDLLIFCRRCLFCRRVVQVELGDDTASPL